MFLKRFCIVVTGMSIAMMFGCATLEKGKDYATSMIPGEADEKLYSQVPEEEKESINPLLDAVKESQERLELAKAMVKKQEAALDLEKAKKGLAGIELDIREAELSLGKMKAVQEAGLGDAKKVNQQVAKLEAKVYKLKGEEAKHKADVENAKLSLAAAQQKVEMLEMKAPEQGEETKAKE
jgi:hypothetical protein